MDRRSTIQKELVYNAVLSMRRHVTADEVYNLVKENYPSIGKGTVYRNLSVLAEEGRVRRVEIPGGPDRYDFTLERHYHVRCTVCGAVADADLREMPDITALVSGSHGYEILDFDILFKGICPECRKSVL